MPLPIEVTIDPHTNEPLDTAAPQLSGGAAVDDDQPCSKDAFWGGKLWLSQPQQGFRAGTASVLFSAFLPASMQGRHIESLVDLGAGVGTLGLLAAARLPGLRVQGFEVMPEIVKIAQRNSEDLGLKQRVGFENLDIFDSQALQQALAGRQAQALVCNPPFTDQEAGRSAQQAYRASAHQRSQSLEEWLTVAKICLVAGGWAFWVLPASYLQAAMQAAARTDFGAAKVMPVQSFADRAARLVLLAFRKNRRGASQLLPPFVLYSAPGQHSPQAQAVLQEGRGIWDVCQMPFEP